MRLDRRVRTLRVCDEAGRQGVLAVLNDTYRREKNWVSDASAQFPEADLCRDDISWFVVFVRDRPAGVLRINYSPSLNYEGYGLTMLDPGLDATAFIRDNRIAEIGRFAVRARYRRQVIVAAALMRAAAQDTVDRGYTHYVTDVFEDEKHSPLNFHTRVMGFMPVARHDTGELNSPHRRITMVLDLKAAYIRLKTRGNWIFRFLTGQWADRLHMRMAS